MSCELLWNCDPAFINVHMNLSVPEELRDVATDLVDLVGCCVFIYYSDHPHQLLLGHHHGLQVVCLGKTGLKPPVQLDQGVTIRLPDAYNLEL